MPATFETSYSPSGESKFVSKKQTKEESQFKSEGSKSKRSRSRRRTPVKSKTPALSHSSMSGDERRSKSREPKEEEEDTKEEWVHLSPMQHRPKPSENYEKPVSGRETWWRSTIKETPAPGSYDTEGFLGALRRRKVTYGFKSDGRRLDPQPQIGKGKYLLPGAYQHEDLEKRVLKFSETYGFKNTSRESRDMMLFGRKDKDINVSPDAYEMERYLSIHADKLPSKHWSFKSGTVRFPTKQFKPKEGPGPGHYPDSDVVALHPVSSSFKSKTPRFSTSHTKVPGPGSYTSTVQSPLPATISNMGRVHGIFFSSAFQA